MKWRVETGFHPPYSTCGHRHRKYIAARICAERAASKLPHDAVRLVAVDDLSVVVHVEHWTRQRVVGEPWKPEVRSS